MAKRLLLFVVCCFVSVSYTFGQCNKNYAITINKKPTQYYLGPGNGKNITVKSYLCKGEKANFEITNIDSGELSFKWYKNDTLVAEKSSSFETTTPGIYRVVVQDKECVYNFGNQELAFVETIDVRILGNEFTICENVYAPFAISSTINFYSSDIKYQWQRDGKDSVGATYWHISPKNAGTYALRATAGACSATSPPVTVKASPDNIIKLPFYTDLIPRIGPFKDTLVLCKDNNNSLIINRGGANWFVNDKFIGNYTSITPKESGNYYFTQHVNDQCMVKSDPVYISVGTKLPPINFDPVRVSNLCGLVQPEINDANYRYNGNLKFYDAQTGDLKYNFANTPNNYYKAFKLGKYKVEYQIGTCIAEPAYIDYSKHKVSLMSNNEKVGGKKITLCNNGSMVVDVRHTSSDEVELYKDGILYQTKPANQNFYINLTESGKYHVKVTLGYCSPKTEIISDTLEIVATEPISTALTLSGETCNAQSIQAKEYQGFSYTWYRNGTIVSKESSSVLPLKSNGGGTYSAVLQKGLCSVATQEITLDATITGNTNLCQGNKLLLKSAGKEGIYSWIGPNNFTSNLPDIAIDKVDTRHAGWYFLSFTKNSCTSRDSIQVKINPQPNLSFRFLEPICLNNDLLLEVRGAKGGYEINYDLLGSFKGYKYFSNPDSLVYVNLGKLGASVPENYANKLDLTYYPCTFPITIPEPSQPQICSDSLQFIGLKKTYCYKDKETIRLNIPKYIPAGTKFKLYLQTVDNKYYINTFSGDSLQMQFIFADDKNSYFYIESENGKYKSISPPFKLNGHKFPIFGLVGTEELSDTLAQCEGYSTKLKAYLTYRSTIQWKKDGIPIENAIETTFQAKEAGNYTLSARFDDCIVESNVITIKVDKISKPNISSVIKNYTSCNGLPIPLKANRNSSYTDFEWKKDGRVVEKKSQNEAFEAKDSGYYSVTAYQGACKSTSDSILVQIGEYLPNTIFARDNTGSLTNKLYICDGNEANIYYSGFSADSLITKYGISFQWKLNGKSIPEATKTNMYFSEAGIYSLQIKQGDCITNSNAIELIRQNTIPVKLSNNHGFLFTNLNDTITNCLGKTIGVYANYKYDKMHSWEKELYKDGKLVDSFTELKGDNNSNYFYIKESGKYSMKLYSAGQKSCVAITDTVNFKFADTNIQLPKDTAYACADTSYISSPYYSNSFRWTYNDSLISKNYNAQVYNEGIYKIEARETNNCAFVQEILFQKKLRPTITQSWNHPIATSISLCEGKNIELFLAGIDDRPNLPNTDFIIEWYNNEQKLTNTSYSLIASQAGNYYVRIKDKNCEATSNSITLNISQIKKQLLPSIDSLALCINGGFETLEASKENGYTYEWFKDNISLEETASSLKVTQEGIYKALIQSGDCSALTSSVKVYPSTLLPTATISGDTLLNIDDTANLKLSFTSSPPFTYKLSNNQEGTSQTNTIIHPVKVEEASIFQLASVKNACGEGTVSGEAKIQVIILANEPLIGHKVVVAPVPAESYCEIIFDLPTSQEVSYQLLDVKGQQLSEKNLGQVSYKKQYLNLNHLAAGEYLIRIQIGKDFVTRKLIKF